MFDVIPPVLQRHGNNADLAAEYGMSFLDNCILHVVVFLLFLSLVVGLRYSVWRRYSCRSRQIPNLPITPPICPKEGLITMMMMMMMMITPQRGHVLYPSSHHTFALESFLSLLSCHLSSLLISCLSQTNIQKKPIHWLVLFSTCTRLLQKPNLCPIIT